jgi:autophagy-related protein 2
MGLSDFIQLTQVPGWARMLDTLNDLWTPDVKANQLSDILAGVAPIRSLVNIGSGVADLVLLPVAAYKEDRRISTGLQKGARSFLKSTALETLKMGARLATGTQVILERTESIFGAEIRDSITAEALPGSPESRSLGRVIGQDSISRYANQPGDVKEGLRSAYKSLSKNFTLAGQTILALPLEVHERSGSEVGLQPSCSSLLISSQGAVRTVVRAVPIALLRPMIGASEAVSKTLLGLRNTVDPMKRHDDEYKYKRGGF